MGRLRTRDCTLLFLNVPRSSLNITYGIIILCLLYYFVYYNNIYVACDGHDDGGGGDACLKTAFDFTIAVNNNNKISRIVYAADNITCNREMDEKIRFPTVAAEDGVGMLRVRIGT